MEIERRRKGRPRKEKDTLHPWQFARAAMAMAAYDEARGRGEKHSAAVQYAVDFVRQRHPEMPISQTEVRRTLAKCRPRGSSLIFRFERSSLNEEDIKRLQWILEALTMSHVKKGLKLPALPNYDPGRSVEVFKFCFAERPDYPRHNRKIPKE